jgi:hypothetical protein
MRAHFLKSSRRHYGVVVERDRGPAVMVEPAPGYDDFLPHDLLHFVAEVEWGLDDGIFGQLAAGRDPGLFLPVDGELVGKWVRNRKLRKTRPTECARSEALAAVLDAASRARSGRAALPRDWHLQLAAAGVEPERLERVHESLDGVARRWHRLQVGGSLALEWPRPERRSHRRTRTSPRLRARRLGPRRLR